jgi:hypothetical protein
VPKVLAVLLLDVWNVDHADLEIRRLRIDRGNVERRIDLIDLAPHLLIETTDRMVVATCMAGVRWRRTAHDRDLGQVQPILSAGWYCRRDNGCRCQRDRGMTTVILVRILVRSLHRTATSAASTKPPSVPGKAVAGADVEPKAAGRRAQIFAARDRVGQGFDPIGRKLHDLTQLLEGQGGDEGVRHFELQKATKARTNLWTILRLSCRGSRLLAEQVAQRELVEHRRMLLEQLADIGTPPRGCASLRICCTSWSRTSAKVRV